MNLDQHNQEAIEIASRGTPESRAAFDEAVASGRLSEVEGEANWAGDYMYMGKCEHGKSLFKHIDTRKYLN